MPREIVNWPIFSFDWRYFIFGIIVDEKPELSIVRLAAGVEVSLQLHEELIGCRAEPDFDLFSLLNIFCVDSLLTWFLSEDLTPSLIGFLIKENSHDEIAVVSTDFRDFKKFNKSTLNFINFGIVSIHFHYFVVVAEVVDIIGSKPDQREMLLVEVTRTLVFLEHSHLLQSGER